MNRLDIRYLLVVPHVYIIVHLLQILSSSIEKRDVCLLKVDRVGEGDTCLQGGTVTDCEGGTCLHSGTVTDCEGGTCLHSGTVADCEGAQWYSH